MEIDQENKYNLTLEKFFEEETQNIVELLDEKQRTTIYMQVSQKFSDDKSDMGDKIDKLKSAVKLASLISERDKPFLGASDVVFPLAANACIQYGSTAYEALFPDDDIVKSKIIGNDKGKPAVNSNGEVIFNPQTNEPIMQFVGYKEEVGKRVTTMMNYQLTDEIPYWKSDAINSMYRLPAVGTMFKKTFWDFITNVPSSKFIYPDKIVINPACKVIDGNVWSEIIDVDRNIISSNIKRGLWIDYDYKKLDNSVKTENNTIKDNDDQNSRRGNTTFEFIEQHTFLDLDDDGIVEPYGIIFDKSAQKIVRIWPDYDLEDIKRNEKDEIYYIARNEILTYFGFLPSFDGSFWSTGYAELLTNNNAAINTTINQMIDCGNLKQKGGGFISTGVDLRSGSLTYKMGEYKKVNVAGGNLAANIFPMPFPEPSSVMFALLGLLIESGKEVGSLRDVLTGDTAANMAPTTYMGLVSQGMKQSIAILKNNHESFKKEFKIIRKLNKKYLSREKYAEVIDEEDPNNVSPEMDFSEKKCNIVLVSDTSALTSAQKFAQAQLLISLKDDPYYNQIEVRKMFNEAIQMAKLNELVSAPPPSPDAALVLAQAEDKKANAKLAEAQMKAQETISKINEAAEKMQLVYADIKLKESEVFKNIADALNQEKELSIKELAEQEKAITNRINSAIQARSIEIQKETSTKSENNDNQSSPEESSSGMAE